MRKLAIKFLKIFLTIALVLFLSIAAFFTYLFQRDLNRAGAYVSEKMKEPESSQKTAPPDLIAAFDILYPEEKSYGNYISYLRDRLYKTHAEPVNTMVTRTLAFLDRIPNRQFVYHVRLFEIGYHVQKLSREQKITFLYNRAAAVMTEWNKVDNPEYAKSICGRVYFLVDTRAPFSAPLEEKRSSANRILQANTDDPAYGTRVRDCMK